MIVQMWFSKKGPDCFRGLFYATTSSPEGFSAARQLDGNHSSPYRNPPIHPFRNPALPLCFSLPKTQFVTVHPSFPRKRESMVVELITGLQENNGYPVSP